MDHPQTIVEVGADITKYASAMDAAGSHLQTFTTQAQDTGEKSGGFLSNAFAFATGGLITSAISGLTGTISGFFSGAIDESNQWNGAMSQTEAVIKSTGGAAGMTTQQMGDLASSLSGANGVSMAADDAILKGENLLATFTNIGADTFPKATQTMVDMAQALGTDVSGGAIQLGKALNDPIAGISALSRVGVTFTQGQKDTIAQMMAMNDVSGAQKIILDELSKEFGGSAAAAAGTFQGQMFTLSEQFNNVKQSVGDAVIPILQALAGFASSVVVPAIQNIVDILVSFGKYIGAVVEDGDTMNDWLSHIPGFLQAPAQFLGEFADTVRRVAAVIAGAFSGGLKLDAIQALPGWLQPVATLFGTIAENVGEFFRAIQGGTPFLQAIGDLIQNNLVDELTLLGVKGSDAAAFVSGFRDTLGQIGGFLMNTVVPALGSFAAWVGQQIPPAIAAWQNAWSNTLWPALQTVWGFIQTTLLPTLGNVATWLGQQLPTVGAIAAGIWTNVLLPAQTALGNFIVQVLFPALGQLATWLSVNVPQAIQTLSNFWTNTLQPALTTVWNYINTNILPILGSVVTWLGTNVPTAVTTVANFWNNTLMPALRTAWTFFSVNIVPILQSTATTLTTTLGTALTTSAGVWNNTVVPALRGAWTFVNTSLVPLFKAFSDFFGAVFDVALTASAGIWQKVLLPALTAAWDFVSKSLSPVFTALGGKDGPLDQTGQAMGGIADMWTNTLKPAAEAMAGFIGGALQGAFNGVKAAIQAVIDTLNALTDGLKNVHLPDWMTPGSPTPWEIGLRGVHDALGAVARSSLPDLGRALDRLPGPRGVGAPTSGAISGGITANLASAGLAAGNIQIIAYLQNPNGTLQQLQATVADIRYVAAAGTLGSKP